MRDNPRITALFDKLHAAGVSHRCFWQTRRDGKPGKPDIEFLNFVGDGFSPSIATAVIINYDDDGYGLYVESGCASMDADVALIAKPRGDIVPAVVPSTGCYALAIDNDDACELHLFATEAERDEFMWEYAFDNTDTEAADLAEFKASYDNELSDAMEATNDGWHTDEMVAPADPIRNDANDTVDALVQAEEQLAIMAGMDESNGGKDTDLRDALVGVRAALKREQAAPDMLAALKAMRGELDEMSGYWTEGMANFAQQADLAIDKAEGRKPDTSSDKALVKAMFDLLCDNLDAWDGEEDSVKEEHEDLIAETEAFIEKMKAEGRANG